MKLELPLILSIFPNVKHILATDNQIEKLSADDLNVLKDNMLLDLRNNKISAIEFLNRFNAPAGCTINLKENPLSTKALETISVALQPSPYQEILTSIKHNVGINSNTNHLEVACKLGFWIGILAACRLMWTLPDEQPSEIVIQFRDQIKILQAQNRDLELQRFELAIEGTCEDKLACSQRAALLSLAQLGNILSLSQVAVVLNILESVEYTQQLATRILTALYKRMPWGIAVTPIIYLGLKKIANHNAQLSTINLDDLAFYNAFKQEQIKKAEVLQEQEEIKQLGLD